jgi:hypothetical protein
MLLPSSGSKFVGCWLLCIYSIMFEQEQGGGGMVGYGASSRQGINPTLSPLPPFQFKQNVVYTQ